MTTLATVLWVVLAPMVWLSLGILVDKLSGVGPACSAAVALLFFVPLWTALYFAIGMILETVG